MTTTAVATITPDAPSRITVDCPYRMRDSIKAVPGARWDTKTRIWTVPLSWPACLALRAEFGEHLTLDQSVRDWAKPIAKSKSELIALRPEVDGIVLPRGAELPGMSDLYPHQIVDAIGISEAGRYMLMNGTGTGKTRSALAGLSLMQESGKYPFPALIAAPLSMLRTWEDEIRGFFPDADIRVVVGTPTKIRKALEPGADFYVICWDSLRSHSRLAAYPSVKMTDKEKEEGLLNELGLRTFVGDEIHRCSNPKSKRTRAAWYLAHPSRTPYAIGLTGTPMQDTPEDLYGIIHLLTPDEYPSKTSYMERYIAFDWNEYGGRDVTGIRDDRAAEWEGNFDARTRRMTKEMVLDFLPPTIETVRWVTLPPKHRKAYEELENTYMTELETTVMAVDNQLTLAGRLIQLSNAMGDMVTETVFKDGEEVEKQRFVMSEDDSPKVDAFVEDYIEGDYDGEQIVVFSDSRQLIERCAEALRKKKVEFVAITGDVTGDDRKAAMDAFQEGKYPICLLTRAGGEGITLTAASTMVRLVRSWSLTVHQQVQDRVHRIGSERHEQVRYVDYVTEDTVEMGQMVRLAEKDARSKATLRDGELLGMLKARKGL